MFVRTSVFSYARVHACAFVHVRANACTSLGSLYSLTMYVSTCPRIEYRFVGTCARVYANAFLFEAASDTADLSQAFELVADYVTPGAMLEAGRYVCSTQDPN